MTDHIKLAIARREELNAEFRALEKFIRQAEVLSNVTDRVDLTQVWAASSWPDPIEVESATGPQKEVSSVEKNESFVGNYDYDDTAHQNQLVKSDKWILAGLVVVLIGVLGWYAWEQRANPYWQEIANDALSIGESIFNPVDEVVPEPVVEPAPEWDGIHWQFTYKSKQADTPIITLFDRPGAEQDCKDVKRMTLEQVDRDNVIIASCNSIRMQE